MLKITKRNIPVGNFAKGRQGYTPEIIVIHIMDGTFLGTDSWFRDPVSGVSSHYGVSPSEIYQWVDEKDTAFHAGIVLRPKFELYKPGVNPNFYTIGIEHVGKPLQNDVWGESMKNLSAELIADIAVRNNIPLDRKHIIGHYQIRADKPNCPAVNKAIIDELIALAKVKANQPVKRTTQEIAQEIINLAKQLYE